MTRFALQARLGSTVKGPQKQSDLFFYMPVINEAHCVSHLGVMESNIALNFSDNDTNVSAYNKPQARLSTAKKPAQ